MATDIKYAYDQGHQVASHTWAHKDLTTLSGDQSKPTGSIRFTKLIPITDLVDDEMRRVEGMKHRSALLVYMADDGSHVEALTKIVGVVPSFTRPRTYLTITPYILNLTIVAFLLNSLR